MTFRKPLLKFLKQCEAFIYSIQDGGDFPAMVGVAELDLGRSFLELIVEMLNAWKAPAVYVGSCRFQGGLTLKAYPEIARFTIGDLSDINVPGLCVHLL